MNDGSLISISSDNDEYDINPSPPLEYSFIQPSPTPFPNNAHKKSLASFFTNKKGRKRIFHKPNEVQTRSGNGNGRKDNGKGREVGRKKKNEIVFYARKLGHKWGAVKCEASAARRMSTDLIFCYRKVSNK